MRSGRRERAAAMPARPPSAVATSKSPAVSSASAATSRMSSSSSMMRMCLRGMARTPDVRDHVVEQMDDALFECFRRDTAFGEELRLPQRQAFALRQRRLARRIDDDRHRAKHTVVFQPIDDGISIDVWKNEVENE